MLFRTHIVEPYSSDIEAMTPGTRRKLLEHTVYKAPDLKVSSYLGFSDKFSNFYRKVWKQQVPPGPKRQMWKANRPAPSIPPNLQRRGSV